MKVSIKEDKKGVTFTLKAPASFIKRFKAKAKKERKTPAQALESAMELWIIRNSQKAYWSYRFLLPLSSYYQSKPDNKNSDHNDYSTDYLKNNQAFQIKGSN